MLVRDPSTLGDVNPYTFLRVESAMKHTAFWLTMAACCAFSAGSALAQGAGQGQHEVGSGVDNPSVPAGVGSGVNNPGQGTFGPNGSSGADISSGPNSNAAGQGAFEAGGPGGAVNGAVVNPGGPIVGTAPQYQVVPGPNGWRFVFSDGMWWYYQPDKSWVYFQNGGWQNFHEPRTASRTDEANRERDNIQSVPPENRVNNNAQPNNNVRPNASGQPNINGPVNNGQPNRSGEQRSNRPGNQNNPNNANSNTNNPNNGNPANTTNPTVPNTGRNPGNTNVNNNPANNNPGANNPTNNNPAERP